MQASTICRYAFSLCAAAALLSGCGTSQPPTGAPGAPLQAPASALARTPLHPVLPTSSLSHVVYRFPGSPNAGIDPQAALIDVNGTLYGTTMRGGSKNCHYGCGAVFSVDAGGNLKVLHSFTGGSDGGWPAGALVDVDGTLYGAAELGGSNSGGVIYNISTSGSEKVLYSFGAGYDGSVPTGPLIDVGGTLYGTTESGGTGGGGTVFSLTTSGGEHVLHSFCGSTDGCVPSGGLLNVDGTLYGITVQGGGHGCAGVGCGTVYDITTAGTEQVLHSFTGGSDGEQPSWSVALINLDGTLYGTTLRGGGTGCNGAGCGTAYSITTQGSEQVLHSFTGGRDGALPHAGLISVNGTLYGTTLSGGGTPCTVDWNFPVHGCGTIYTLTTSGEEHVRLRFTNEYRGEPAASLLKVGDVLYGTTQRDSAFSYRPCSAHSFTCGTVFAVTL